MNNWDLTQIYKNEKDLNTDINLINDYLEKTIKYKNKILENGNTLYKYLLLTSEFSALINKLFVYCYLQYDENTLVEKSNSLKEKINKKYLLLNQELVWAEIEIKKITSAKFNKFIKEEPKLKKYEYLIKEIIRNKKHELKDSEKIFLSKINECLETTNEHFNKLNNTDIKLSDIYINEKKYELNFKTYSEYLSGDDRKLREKALENMHIYYKEHINTISSLYIKKVKSVNTFSKILKFNNILENNLFECNINKLVYNNLINIVNKNIPQLKRSLDLKKEHFKLEKLYYYDLYAYEKINDVINIEKAKKIILDVVSVYGEEYKKNVQKAFNENWIDFNYRNGKKSGAYSMSCYSVHPYILMNFSDNINSVYTLIHELGHSMHEYFAIQNQIYEYSGEEIFLAEIASIVNETLLSNYLLRKASKTSEKLTILNNILNSFRTTLFRQTQFSEFEQKIMEKYINDVDLTEQVLTNTYEELNEKYYGESVIVPDYMKYEWARIPHFYRPFYVYQYATGKLIATAIARDILSKDQDKIDKYLTLLKSGSSNSPLNLLKEAGYDLLDNKIFENAMKTYNDYLKEYEELIKINKN